MILVWLWGARLSYNYYRKGGYKMSAEDYRWPELRKKISNRLLFELFNLTFISIFQNILLLLISSPIYYVWKYGNQTALNNLDLIATVLFLLFFTFETIADEQQWNFHLKKQKQQSFKTGSGFLREGLFRYSRHPNFFLWNLFVVDILSIFRCCQSSNISMD